ncbi:MAG TPA: ABC transporter ATP-binding protein [Solirubrobacteraceae bacterium]
MAEIQLENVTKRYPDGTEAVKGISLTIGNGELMILVGPSGCGKTTALQMLAGLEEISSGTVRIGGRPVNHLTPKQRDVAMVFQNYALYPHMTVRENMGFALRLAKVDKREIRRRVQEAAEILDLTQHLDRRPAKLSGGQRQRVAMGRAIVRDPQAFLMDEPLSNLDAKLRVEMRIEVARLQKRLGTTTVYVTHDQTEAMTLGHRVAVMRDGLIQQVATPQRLYDEPSNLFVAGFIGSPPMNFLAARLSADRIELPFGELELPDAVRARLPREQTAADVIAGIRPEGFADLALGGERTGMLSLTPRIEIVESMGSEVYAYFEVASRMQLRTDLLASDARRQLVARLPATTHASAGEEARLGIDTRGLLLFDPASGESLLAPVSESGGLRNGTLPEARAASAPDVRGPEVRHQAGMP